MSKSAARLTKRQFLRRLIVGSGAVTFVAGDYLKPELETLLGSNVAHARASGTPPWANGNAWGRGGSPKS